MTADPRTHPLRLVFAAIQPILFVWATIVVLGIFSYTLMADSPALGATTWQDVASLTTGWWMTAYGGTLHFDGVSISLPPLFITLVTYLVAVGFLRKLPLKDWIDVTILAVASGATTVLLGLLAPMGSNGWLAGIGAALVSMLAALSSKNRTDWFGEGFFRSVAGRAIYDGFMLARRATLVALILALVASLAAVIAGWSNILQINDFYIVEWHSNVMMWLFQLMYLPVYVIWALAYIVGAGFAVGAGTSFSALGITSAPLPAIPILGALPQPGEGTPWVIAIAVVAMVLLGVRQARAFPDLKEVVITAAIQIVIVALLGSILAVAAQGAIGPDRLSHTGAESPRMALASAIVIGLPHLAGMVLGHRTATAKYRLWITAGKNRIDGLRSNKPTNTEAPATVPKASSSPVSPSSPQSAPSSGSARSVDTAGGTRSRAPQYVDNEETPLPTAVSPARNSRDT